MRRTLTAMLVLGAFAALPGSAAAGRASCKEGGGGDFSLKIVSRGVGCERVARVVSIWSARRGCVSRAGAARACHVRGFRCAAVDGGSLARLAGAACHRGRAGIEFVIRHVCTVDMLGVQAMTVTTLTGKCAAAQRVGREWWSSGTCRRRPCTIEAWTCRPAPWVGTRCLRAQRPREPFELRLGIVLEGGDGGD